MVSRKVIIAVGIAAAVILGLTYMGTTRTRAMRFDTPRGGVTYNIEPYNGKFRDNPRIRNLIRDLPGIMRRAESRVSSKTRKKAPPITVNIQLSDEFESDTYFIPSCATKCPKRPYSPDKGNCKSYTIIIGVKPFIDDYKGRTTIDKMMTHELTHIWMMFYVPNIDSELDDSLIEGIPIDVAGQKEEIRRTQSRERPNGNGYHYNPSNIEVDTYSKLIDGYERSGKDPSCVGDESCGL